LKLKCTQFDFGWGSSTDPARETYSVPLTQDLVAGFQGPCASKGEEGKEREGRIYRKMKGRGKETKEGRERREKGDKREKEERGGTYPTSNKSFPRPWT